MRHDARAVVFDLDDTLYPYRRFLRSGFLAVARHLSVRAGLDARIGFRTLIGAARGGHRGAELQACLSQHDLPPDWIGDLVEILRYHEPRLRLPRSSRRLLHDLREDGWRLGVLTNGPRSIQAAKVAALGLTSLVDVVGYATAIATGRGKPDPETFAWMARQLSVPAARSVFVGDSEACDVEGARAAGMLPVRCAVWIAPTSPTAARAVVNRLRQVPAAASSLLEEATNYHAA